MAGACVSFWIALSTTATGDWSADSWPAVRALGLGHIGAYLSAKAIMGPFATLVEAPFAALGGGDVSNAYRWAALPCLLAAASLGAYLADLARRRGAPRLKQAVIAVLCLVNPLTFEALHAGHPEEVLTAALAIGAVAAAADGRRRWAIALLGLALASKQWAVIAILPTLLALPERRIRTGLAAVAVAALLLLPNIVASPSVFSDVQGHAASAGRIATPWSAWYPLTHVNTEVYRVDGTHLVARIHEAPHLAGTISHPLIVLLALGLPLLLVLSRGRATLNGSEAMALLALLALLRCVLDPVDNLYYHEPLLLALVGWDAFAADRLPSRGLVGAAFALLFWRWWSQISDIAAFNAAYLTVSCVGIALVAAVLARSRRWTSVGNSDRLSPRLFYGSPWRLRRVRREA